MATLQQNANVCCFPTIGPFEIPRPKCIGMQFVSIRGRYGYYQTVNKQVALKYGMQQRNGVRRPTLPDYWVDHTEGGGTMRTRTKNIPEERAEEPTPDYEQPEGRRKRGDRIAVPSGRAPPAPPLPAWLRQELVQLQRKTTKKAANLAKSPFDLMANGGGRHYPFMGTFLNAEARDGRGMRNGTKMCNVRL